MSTDTTDPQAWMIAELQTLQGVKSAIVATSDGMIITHSQGIDREHADRLAATISGLISLGRAASENQEHRPLSQIALDYEGAMLLVTSVGQARNSLIATLTELGADIGLVTNTMATLAPSLASHLDVADRTTLTAPVR
ncbi:roadblock/LC7 domain-containing protein [Streptomyces sp. NPDC059611]|uniref:roadblock/LC7 domain-containing protein n=1 Tax=Streptomyces sp. NPDC059611 TaxID=3346884 RepID=UPI0036BF4D8D